MSKENVAKFIKSIAEQPELNKKVAAAAKQTDSWVKLGNEAGAAFSSADFVGFVKDVTGKGVNESNAVQALLSIDDQLDAAQLDQVAGGAIGGFALQFSPKLFTQIGSQFGNIGGLAASFVKTSGPTFVKSGSSMPGGGQQF